MAAAFGGQLLGRFASYGAHFHLEVQNGPFSRWILRNVDHVWGRRGIGAGTVATAVARAMVAAYPNNFPISQSHPGTKSPLARNDSFSETVGVSLHLR